MDPNTVITLRYPASSTPNVTLAPLPNWERASDVEAVRRDVRVMCTDGYVFVRARYWQWQTLAWVIEALEGDTNR